MSVPVPLSPKKRGYLKGLQNWTTNNTPLKNRHITRVKGTIQDALLVVLTTKVNDLDNELVKDKGNTYYTAFLVESETPKDPTTLAKALLWPRKEANKWHEAVLKEYYSL